MRRMAPPPALVLDRVTVTRDGVMILDNVSVALPAGRATSIIGPNGAGKTTLLAVILDQTAFSGAIRFAAGRPRIGYVPQKFEFDRGLPITVLDLLCAGRQRLPLWFGAGRNEREAARRLLASVRAEALADRRLGVLSGGEFQRVLLAQALQQDPELLLLDEPGAGVDAAGDQLFCELLEDLRRTHGFTQVMVSHNLSVVAAHAEHAVLLNRRVLAEGSPCEVMTPENLQAAYGVHMAPPAECPAHGRACPRAPSCSCGHEHA